jgi:uncharacterized protein YoxC
MTEQLQTTNGSSINNLLQNKQLIHIGLEVVALCGLAMYFSNKNKKLTSHIEDLTQKIDEQEDEINKLKNSLQQQKQNFENFANQISHTISQNNLQITNLRSDLQTVMNRPIYSNQSVKQSQPAKPVQAQQIKTLPIKSKPIQSKPVPVQLVQSKSIKTKINKSPEFISVIETIEENQSEEENNLTELETISEITNNVSVIENINEVESESESDSELDELIKDELQELENDSENSLKKHA